MRHIFAIITALFLFMPSFSFAEEKKESVREAIFTSSPYIRGSMDNDKDTESLAKNDAQRQAAEWAGVFVRASSVVSDAAITKDVIETIAASVFSSEVVETKWSADNRTVTVKIKAKYNETRNEKILESIIQTEQLKLQAKDQEIINKKMKEDFNNLTKQVAELNKKLADTKIEPEKKQIETEISKKKKLIDENRDVNYWFVKGYYHTLRYEDIEAIEAYNKAIKINPDLAFAYNNSGVVYFNKGEYNIAIQDYNKAIAIDPKLALVYRNRGDAYAAKGQYDKAVEDYNKVLTIDPDYARDMHTRTSLEKAKKWRDIQDRTQGILIDTLQRACKYGDTLSCEELKKHSK